MRIQHNIAAMNAYRNYNLNTSAVSKNLEKLSSGYKINRAGDDAAGLAISEKMRAQITGLDAASKNVKDGISLVKTAEGAMQEVQDMLNRMVSLATQSANGTYQDAVDRENLQAEVDQLRSEINRIADSANFNGIKLLDGSLAEKVAATKIDVVGPGLTTTKSEGAKGKYTSGTAIADTTYAGKVADGDTFQYTVSLADGTSKTVKLTLEHDATEKKNYLVAEDGTKYNVAGTKSAATTVTAAELGDAFVKELNKSAIGKDYNISFASGKLTLEAKEVGTAASKVTAFDFEHVLGGTRATTGMSVKVDTVALDEGRELAAADITEFDGTNLDDALFTINGHKFLLLSENLSGKDGTTAPDLFVKAGMEVPSDVTILIGGQGGLKAGATVGTAPNGNAANGNFEQNIKKIAEVTGLNVTDAVNEATPTGVAPGAGIRLTLGKGTTGKGLMLQIGDTSDPYNQLKVNIGDIHTKALGLDKITIGTQKGAQDAIDVIKNAINTVSSIRGTLGATQNRLEHTQNNLSVMKENIQDAESTIRDTDVAEEMMAYTKNNILVQSAQAMLAQANQIPQGVLQLLG